MKFAHFYNYNISIVLEVEDLPPLQRNAIVDRNDLCVR